MLIQDSPGFNQQKPWNIGRTSLRLQSQGSFALFTCGDELWRVSYNPNLPGECLLWRVWITDQSNVSSKYPFQRVLQETDHDLAGLLPCNVPWLWSG